MTNPPPFPEQRQIVQDLEASAPMKPGELAYLIDATWYHAWQTATDPDIAPESAEPLGPIDNTALFDSTSRLSSSLVSTAREGTDYEIVPASVYAKLKEWYSIKPPLSFRVHTRPDGTAVAARPYHVLVHWHKSTMRIEVTHCTTVSNLLTDAVHLGYSRSHVSLFDYSNKVRGERFDPEKTLGELQVQPDQALLIDYTTSATTSPASLSRPATLNGKVGLQNLGNTCFFNSGTQCLLHTRLLARRMLEASSLEINARNPLGMKGLLVTAFAGLCKQVWFGGSSSTSPAELKRVIGRFAPQFSGWQQHDSHELLTFMLDGIHEDLNHPSGTVSVDGVFGDGTNDEETAERAWERHTTRNRSIVVDHIHGQYRSQLTCPECKKVSVVFDPFMSIPLPISKPHCARIRVVVVPYDFAQPVRTLVAYASTRENPVPDRVLTEQIGGGTFLFGCPDYVEGVKWTVTVKAKVVYAFELPDPALRYVPASVRRVHKVAGTAAYVKDLSKVFLIGLPEAGATREEIDAVVEQRLASVWEINDQDEAISDEVKKLIGWESPSEKDVAFPEGAKFIAALRPRVNVTVAELSTSAALQKSATNPRVFSGWISILLNPKIPFSLARVSRSLDVFKTTNLEAVVDERVSLDDCFTFLSEPETLDEKNQWFCPNCRKHVCAEKIVGIWKVPDVLIIQLKRFVRSGYSVSKLGTFVNFPDVINMADFIVGPQRANQTFRLYAVSNHMGGLGGGHYTAHAVVQDPSGEPDENAPWYSFNDSSAGQARPQAWHSPEAYVLFYERVSRPIAREDSEDTLLAVDS